MDEELQEEIINSIDISNYQYEDVDDDLDDMPIDDKIVGILND